MAEEKETIVGLPEPDAGGGIYNLLSMLSPTRFSVVEPRRSVVVDDMGGYALVKPGQYEFEGFTTPQIVTSGIDAFKAFMDDPVGSAKTGVAGAIEGMGDDISKGMLAASTGITDTFDPETQTFDRFDPLSLSVASGVPIATGTARSIARTADDGSTVLGIMGGRMAKSGPSKFSEARAARRTKDDQQVFDETGAYFDDELFPDEGDAFRFEIPTVNSDLVGIEDVVRKSNDSSAGPGPRNYFYMDDKTDVTALKQDVVTANIFDDGKVSFESQFVNAAGELEPAKYPRLSEILDFPELYEQYPQLKDVYVARLNGNAQAAMIENGIGGRPTIALSPAFSPQMLQSYLLHEVQHVVQKIEGFPRGGDTTKMSDADYRRLAGEVEARNVEDRFLAARGFQKSGARSDTIPPIYDPSKVVPTQTRDTNPSQILLDDSASAAQLSRLTDLDTFADYLGGTVLPADTTRKVFFKDLDFSNVTIEDSREVPGAINIQLLHAAKKGKGSGSEIMNRITQLADDTGKVLALYPSPYPAGKGGLGLEDLVEFYQRKGFQFQDPDPDRPDLDRLMIRYPRKAEGGIVSLLDVARNTGRGPRGVQALAPVARNMTRPMVS